MRVSRRARSRLAVLALAIGLTSGCGSDSPAGPTATANTSVDGIWSNEFYRWNLVQTGAAVTGTESSLFPGNADGGVITGTMSASVLTIDMTMWRSRLQDGVVSELRYHVTGRLKIDRGAMSGTLTYTPLWDARVLEQDFQMFRTVVGH